jgi:hypothetical protein
MWSRLYFKRIFPSLSRIPIVPAASVICPRAPPCDDFCRLRLLISLQMPAIRAMICKQGSHQVDGFAASRIKVLAARQPMTISGPGVRDDDIR